MSEQIPTQLALPMTNQPIQIWERIELVIGEGPESGLFSCRVEDFIGSGIVISKPEFVEGHSLLRENADVLVLLTRDDAVYQFRSKITTIKKEESRQFLLSLPTSVKRVQRRQHVRIDVCEKMSFAHIRPNLAHDDLMDRITWYDTVTINISAGGLLIDVMEDEGKNVEDDILLLRIPFFDDVSLPGMVVGKCCRWFKVERKLKCGLEFVLAKDLHRYLSNDELDRLPSSVRQFSVRGQSRLADYIFKQQIHLRNKGLL